MYIYVLSCWVLLPDSSISQFQYYFVTWGVQFSIANLKPCQFKTLEGTPGPDEFSRHKQVRPEFYFRKQFLNDIFLFQRHRRKGHPMRLLRFQETPQKSTPKVILGIIADFVLKAGIKEQIQVTNTQICNLLCNWFAWLYLFLNL